MQRIVLLAERSDVARIALVVVVPIVYGALCGVMLGSSKDAYSVLALLAAPGGLVGGMEHTEVREGLIRGAIGGTGFGGAILVVHELTGTSAKASVPHPAILLLVVTISGGVLLGAAGAALRRRSQRRAETAR